MLKHLVYTQCIYLDQSLLLKRPIRTNIGLAQHESTFGHQADHQADE